MRKFRWISAIAALALAACGGGSNGTTNCGTAYANSCGTTTSASNPTVASVLLVSDTATIPSDNSLAANLTAYVQDKNNNFVPNVPVVFTSDSGGISVTQGTTDANGVAKAKISTLANKANRIITITATANKIAATATVVVQGTTLQIQGPASLTAGQQGTYIVTLEDSAGQGIAATAVTVQTPTNLTVGATALTTDSQGRATVTATGAASGSGSLGVTALGITAATAVSVNGAALTFTAPAPNPNIPLETSQSFTVHYVQNGAPVANAAISFATTRGCINPAGATCVGQSSTASVNTNGTGDATVSLLSDNAGGAIVSASVAGATAQAPAQFIATAAASIQVQPSIFTLAANASLSATQLNTSTITAVVRDVNNNLVTGATVVFTLADITGGTLSIASALSDQQGRAQTVYTAGSVASAANGVVITATVQSTAIASSVALTVAKLQVFISIGTGNTILANTQGTQYEKDYIVQVTDSNGAGVAGVPLSMSVLSDYYFKGYRAWDGVSWTTCYTYPSATCTFALGALTSAAAPTIANGCRDEDINRNGILDPGEDNNHNGKIDAGNISLVSPSAVTTDSNGFANVSVFYPEEYAYYLQVTLQAQAAVQGTAFFAQSTFFLPGLAADFNTQSKAPPGPISAFGQSNSCTDTL